jgi:hypothetical protein
LDGLLAASLVSRGRRGLPRSKHGPESPTTIAWDDAAAERMKKIPAFVRGMVVRAVQESCRKSGIDRVTVEESSNGSARECRPEDVRVVAVSSQPLAVS